MRFEQLIVAINSMPYFDLSTMVQVSGGGGGRQSLRMQLSRPVRQGKIKSLRRGMYALGEPYRKVNPNPAVLANRIYTPSYLSFHWALGYYGLIPEFVPGRAKRSGFDYKRKSGISGDVIRLTRISRTRRERNAG